MSRTFPTSNPFSTGRIVFAGLPSHLSQPTLNVAQQGTTKSAILHGQPHSFNFPLWVCVRVADGAMPLECLDVICKWSLLPGGF